MTEPTIVGGEPHPMMFALAWWGRRRAKAPTPYETARELWLDVLGHAMHVARGREGLE